MLVEHASQESRSLEALTRSLSRAHPDIVKAVSFKRTAEIE